MRLNNRKSKATSLKLVCYTLDELPLSLGNFVQLKSGGPIMMIVDFIKDGAIVVAWEDRVGSVFERVYLASCICRASPASARSRRRI